MPPIDKDAKIQCPSPQHLQVELDALMAVLELREQEDTWEKMERGIIRFTGVTRGGGYKHLPLFIDGVGKMGVGLKLGQCMLSDRGRLSGVATELLQTLAPRLGAAFQPLVPVYLPPLIQLLGRPNKVFLKRAEKCLWTIISNCHLPTILFELKKGLSDEAATCRRGCAAGFERALIDWDRNQFGEKGVMCLEEALRKVGGDKDVEVRAIGKRLWFQFSEIWPERIDEFSAPLTPTIRRYLGVSASASAVAGPSKPKPSAQRPAATRPPPSTLSASTSSISVPTVHRSAAVPAPSKAPTPPLVDMPPPPDPRPLALNGRAVRPPLLTTQSEALPLVPRRSPPKFSFPGGPAVPSQLSEAEPSRHRILSARAPRYPPGVLCQHGRSVSHNVLPLPELPLPLPTPDPPTRPSFPTSFSTTSLPIQSEEWAPTRRFPNGAVRIPSSTSISEDSEIFNMAGPSRPTYNPITPHPLRGAFRPTQQPPQRRDLGQAQRRIVTAPTPSSSSSELDILRTSTSVRERISEMERKAAEDVPLPISPAVGRLSRGGTPVKLLAKKEEVVDSPMMPMLARSLRGKEVEVKVVGEMLRDEEIPEDMGDMTLRSDPGKKVDVKDPVVEESSGVDVANIGNTGKESTPSTPDTGIGEAAHIIALPLSPSSTSRSTEVAKSDIIPTPTTHTTSTITQSAPLPPVPPISAPAGPTETKPRKPPLPPIVPKSRPPTSTTTTSERLPPITTIRSTKPRIPAQETRKPFRPTTKPISASSTGNSTKESSAPIPKEQVIRVSKPPIPPRVVSASVKPAVSTKSALPPPPPAPVAVRSRTVSSNLTKPTASSLHRAAPLPTTKTTRPPAVVSTSSTSLPPPIKKDKVKRKAAVPSFRPTRTTESILGKGTVSLSASTSSTTSGPLRSGSSARTGGEIVARVKVKPEAIALPLSPAEKMAVEIPLPPSPAIGEFTGRVKVKARPEEVKVESPIKAAGIPLPLSPTSPSTSYVSSPISVKVPPALEAQGTPTELTASAAGVNDMGLPLPVIRDATPISKSTVEPTSDWMGSDSGDDMDLESEVGDRVIFGRAEKAETAEEGLKMGIEEVLECKEEQERDFIQFSTSTRAVSTPSVVLMADPHSEQGNDVQVKAKQEEEEKDLIEFSAPSRPLLSDKSGGVENDLSSLDVDLSASGKALKSDQTVDELKGSSPRIALGERDRNGFATRIEELLL